MFVGRQEVLFGTRKIRYKVSMTYPAFPSIPRLMRSVVVTEKIDGTNALISISDDGVVRAGSRNRWITPQDDNAGFAQWAEEHAQELLSLGTGEHYGEWWGQGIQRRYGLKEKRFSLFNTGRWGVGGKDADKKPDCCHVVPVLATLDVFDTGLIANVANLLKVQGSVAAPGFMDPEGIVVWHEKARATFKYTLDGDGHKGAK